MIILALFIAACFAQDVIPQEEPKEEEQKSVCKSSQYYSLIEAKCMDLTNCNGTADPFYGCTKCADGYFAFKGGCYQCSCGFIPDSKDPTKNSYATCKNGVGCVSCQEKQVMREVVLKDYSRYFTCVDLDVEVDPEAEEEPTEEVLYGKNTVENCTHWGATGCLGCNGTNYLNKGLCFKNDMCSEYTLAKNENNVDSSVCSNCTSKDMGAGQTLHYYLNEARVCTPCDENCEECDLTSGNCTKCTHKHYHTGGRKCYKCDPQCDVESCVQDDSMPFKHRCNKCNEGYFLVAGYMCVQCPMGCSGANCVDEVGCTGCDNGATHFLIPNDYRGGKNNFHFNYSNVRIGYCVPHQPECIEDNRTINGCNRCAAGYVLDNITYTREDGSSYWNGFCSGAAQITVLALIAFLVFVF